MSERTAQQLEAVVESAQDWWSTDIVDIHPGYIAMRGYPIEELIGHVTFPEMIWLMLRGELPTRPQARLMEAALVSAVDHGPHAPSIAISRMAMTCGVPLNGAIASAINVLDDVHGGAGQQCMELYSEIAARVDGGAALATATAEVLGEWRTQGVRYVLASDIAGTRWTLGLRGCSAWSMTPWPQGTSAAGMPPSAAPWRTLSAPADRPGSR